MTIKHRTRIGNVFGPVVNWGRGFNMEISYNTAVQRYRNGVEERESLRVNPNFRFEFTGHFMGDDAEDFMAEFHRNYAQSWLFPIPFRRQRCTYVVDGNGVLDKTKLAFPDGIPFWAIPGASIIMQTDAVREAMTIASLDVPNNVAVMTAAMVTGISEAMAFAAIPVQFENDTPLRMVTNDVYEIKCGVCSVPGDTVFPIQPFVAPATLSNRPVMRMLHNWRDTLDHTFNPAVRRNDFGFGRKYQKAFYDFVSTTRKLGFMFNGAGEVETYLSFIHAMKGRNGSFWYPDWGALLDQADNASPSQLAFYPSNQFIGRNYSGSKTHRNLYIEFLDGAWFARQITSFQVATQPVYLAFASLGKTITQTNLYRVTWLTLNRLATDETLLVFKSADIGEVEMSMQLLPTREVQ